MSPVPYQRPWRLANLLILLPSVFQSLTKKKCKMQSNVKLNLRRFDLMLMLTDMGMLLNMVRNKSIAKTELLQKYKNTKNSITKNKL
jgi:hypothetical protein